MGSVQPTPMIEVSEFTAMLKEGGLPDRRAEVYARHLLGMSNTEIADELDIEDPGVTEHISEANQYIGEATKLVESVVSPPYVTAVSEKTTRSLYNNTADTSVDFSFHNPDKHEGEYVLGSGSVIEGHFLPGFQAYLLILHKRSRNHFKSGFIVDTDNLVEFISEWVMLNRFAPVESDETTDQWFFTDGFSPEWLESDLEELGIERVEVMIDDRFRNPITDTGVYCDESAASGRYKTGYQIAYRPTDREIGQMLVVGDIGEDEAERIARKSPDTLRSIGGIDG